MGLPLPDSINGLGGIDTILEQILENISSSSQTLLILPPFAGIDRPSLGLHTLQAVSKEAGQTVRVLYANILFSQLIGEARYEQFCYAPTPLLLGERCFSHIAYGSKSEVPDKSDSNFRTALNLPTLPTNTDLDEVRQLAETFVQRLAYHIGQFDFTVVGATTTFEQTAAAIAILNAVKQNKPTTYTIIGGANCEGEMAKGIRQLTPNIDTVFSGESEKTFVNFLRTQPHPFADPIVYGTPCNDMDSLPTVDFTDYYEQLAAFSPLLPIEMRTIWLPYESSRGCWWGQKHHCTFCGINGGGMGFREKKAQKVLEELPKLLNKHPSNMILMVDNIMPYRYFSDLLPALAETPLGIHAFYEQKSNLTLEKVSLLKRAGFEVIQPGIEALSTHLLALMKKGVKAKQNIALLRYARACGVSVNWNMLYAFPGDLEQDYEQTLKLIPLMLHLNPPAGGCHLSIDRFSPYFDQSEQYGITNVRPMDSYFEILPQNVDVSKIAYHFLGDYETAMRRDKSLSHKLDTKINEWREMWKQEKGAPILSIQEIGFDTYLLIDTRSLGNSNFHCEFINAQQAKLALCNHHLSGVDSNLLGWAVEKAKIAVIIDNELVPLAVGSTELISSFESIRTNCLERIPMSNEFS